MNDAQADYVLNLACHETPGLVGDLGCFLADQGALVREANHFGDPESGHFFFRAELALAGSDQDRGTLEKAFAPLAERYGMNWQLYDASYRPRLLILVSHYGHCLNDLLYQAQNGLLPANVVAVASNHPTFRDLVSCQGVPFHYLPVDKSNKADQEQQLLELARSLDVDYIILARYMQILSEEFIRPYAGRIINIHHSFLPGFKGAKPHQQAFDRGVKMVGATAHFVTPHLDEGPIIEQDVTRVDHSFSPQDIRIVNLDIERVVLTRAVRFVAEHRVLLNDGKTVVFR